MSERQQKFHPIGYRLLVKREAPKRQTAGGLYVPETHAERPGCGVVLALGSTESRVVRDVTVGDMVFFPRAAGLPVASEGEDCQLIEYEDILGVYR